MMYDWSMMADYGWGHWIFFAVMAAILLYPIGRILGRIGFSPFWSIVAFIPVINLIGLWVLAFVDWPRRDGPTPG
jgi:hypothetical protein